MFAALGADLVTNDIVAVIELVKNSYDAGARRVEVRFSKAGTERVLEIIDNGSGMDRQIIQDAWCVVATPFRLEHPLSMVGKNKRRVSGEKGLGRLSAARLGSRLEMLTKAKNESCWQVKVDWSTIGQQDLMEACTAEVTIMPTGCPFEDTGTVVKVVGLHVDWKDEQISDLRENLARLLAPFAGLSQFAIYLKAPGSDALPAEVSSPEFLMHPPYSIRGEVSKTGNIVARYEFHPVGGGKKSRSTEVKRYWEDIAKKNDTPAVLKEKSNPGCGQFGFEIRAWDIGPQDTQQLSEQFEMAKSSIRRSISAHKGISVYRDGILALPKSEDARDWLGLDLRRVSRVGTRLSTSQIVGYVSISADTNPRLEDSSNREGFVQTPEVLAFQEILNEIVRALEAERDSDRFKPHDEVKIDQLFEGVSADELVEEVRSLAEDGAIANDVVVKVENFNRQLIAVREAIRQRFVYYSRLATIGSIAQTLVHEIRNRTTGIGRFLRNCGKMPTETFTSEMRSQLSLAESSVMSLENLADTFAPLATRSFRRGRQALIEESIDRCVTLLNADGDKNDITYKVPTSGSHKVPVDPGELDAILLNLLLNASYWVTKSDRARNISIKLVRLPKTEKIRFEIDDSGPGVPESDMERIFLPGVTKRTGGMGMGLTLAAELVSQYGGTLHLVQPSPLGGASFRFELPLTTA